jgi:dihydroorotate dehydrogenase electron transfer subunit
MIWIPGVDEVPMSISYLEKAPFSLGITVQDIGIATNALCGLIPGDWIGIRGPYGSGFEIPSKDEFDTIIGVSGGVGGASTICAMEKAAEDGFQTTNLVGSRSETNMPFRQRWEGISTKLRFSTDDGSLGHHGFVTELLEEELEEMSAEQRSRTMVFSCGPEMMMKGVKQIIEKYGVKGQFSLERFMKCGIGICDSCSMSGYRTCMDGPVFKNDLIDNLEEFGKKHRDRSGRLVPLNECVR